MLNLNLACRPIACLITVLCLAGMVPAMAGPVASAASQGKDDQTRSDKTVYVRLTEAHLRLQPEFEKLEYLETLKFGDEVSVVSEQRDWLLVRGLNSSRTGWVHRLVVAASPSDINALRKSKKIPPLLLYVNLGFDPGRGFGRSYIIDGSIKVQGGEWTSELPPGGAIFVAAVPSFRVSAFLNGRFKESDPRVDTIYYLTETGEFERWEPSKAAR